MDKDILKLLKKLEKCLRNYSNDDNYTLETRTCELIGARTRVETFNDFNGDSRAAKKGIKIVKTIKNKLGKGKCSHPCEVCGKIACKDINKRELGDGNE
ncbi:MAG: hypothetical protein M0P71_01055 [Melioribacteraceae bacterium]|nr:hypothetical protein [Melioribacteraceae bacterium]